MEDALTTELPHHAQRVVNSGWWPLYFSQFSLHFITRSLAVTHPSTNATQCCLTLISNMHKCMCVSHLKIKFWWGIEWNNHSGFRAGVVALNGKPFLQQRNWAKSTKLAQTSTWAHLTNNGKVFAGLDTFFCYGRCSTHSVMHHTQRVVNSGWWLLYFSQFSFITRQGTRWVVPATCNQLILSS